MKNTRLTLGILTIILGAIAIKMQYVDTIWYIMISVVFASAVVVEVYEYYKDKRKKRIL